MCVLFIAKAHWKKSVNAKKEIHLLNTCKSFWMTGGGGGSSSKLLHRLDPDMKKVELTVVAVSAKYVLRSKDAR